MTIYSLPPLISSLLVFGVGIFVFLQNRRSTANITFFFECLCVFMWLFGYFMMYSTTNKSFALWCAKFLYTGVVFIPTLFYHFTVSFLHKAEERRKTLVLLYINSIIFCILVLTTDKLVTGLHDYYWGYHTKVNHVGAQTFFLTFVVIFVLSFRELLLVMKATAEGAKERNRLKYLLVAYVIGLVGGADVATDCGVESYPFGHFIALAWISLIAYSIVRHQLMDIRVIIKKTFAYSLVLLVLITPCFGVVIIAEKYFAPVFYYPVLGALFVLVGFIFPRIKVQAQRNLENILFKGAFDYREALDDLSRKIANLQNLKELLSNTTETIASAIDTNAFGTYLLTNDRQYELRSSYGRYKGDYKIDGSSALVQYMQDTDEIVKNEKASKDSPSDMSILKELDELGAYISIPIKFEHELTGFMVISEKESAGDYSREELKVLSTMANQLAVAVENSRKYEEINELNINLEQKVEERTNELKRANEELKKLDSLKNEFFAKVSHELRTPLTNIILPLQNVLSKFGEQLDPENTEEKKAMLRNARKLLKRINEILDISKLEAGKMGIKASLRDLNSILEDVVVASSIGAKEMGIDLVFEPDNQLIEIYLDTDKMEKVFSNLISNALKFTDRGGKVEIKTKEANDHIEVRINDTGIGIAQEDLPYIFDRFQQVDGSNSRKYEGTGLGLCLVKELVELHHGSVDVTSELGKGTTFTVHLRKGMDHYESHELEGEQAFETSDGFVERREEQRRQEERRGWDRREITGEDRETIDLLQVQFSDLGQGIEYSEETVNGVAGTGEKKKSVLVVEDNRDLAGNIAKSLTKFYHVFVAYNGQQALDRVNEKMPDLIVSDVMMPEMDGYELCEKIKSDERTQHIPLVLLTAKTSIDDKIAGLKHGADQYVAKPFNPNELHAVVDSLLTKKELQAQLNKSNLELKDALHKLEEAQVQLVQAARLETAGQLAAGVAHEIKNNIYCLRAGLDGINKRLTMLSEGKLDIKDTYKSLERALDTNNKAIKHSLFIVNSLLDFSRKNKEGIAFSDINKGIDDTLAMVLPMIKNKVTVHKEYGEITNIECRMEEINQVVMNMLINAYQAMEEKGTVRIKTAQDEDNVTITIADDGLGIPQEHLSKIFTPFFSTKDSQNSGLGLSICYNIIKAHHGTVDVNNIPGQGTEFTIVLPIRQPK
ncbi:MAG: ATP-binding protein [Pseudomonadota bacterium]